MIKNKYYLNNIKPTLLSLGLAVWIVASCNNPSIKEDITSEPEIEIPEEPIDSTKLHDVEIVFSDTNKGTMLSIDTLQKYIDDKTVKTIYLIPTEHWDGYRSSNITTFRKNCLQPRMEMSEKLRGRGDFDFHLGSASMVPNDSLWYIQQGWTINKAHQK